MAALNPSLLTLAVAVLLLFLGERLYWLFVGAIGFIVGMDFASSWLVGQPGWLIILAAVLAGLIGAVLAIFFQRVAIGIAGFLAGGHLAQLAAVDWLGNISGQTSTVVFVGGGILVAILVVVFLDWALIVISALLGAAIIAEWAVPQTLWRSVIFVVLFLFGVAVQGGLMHRRRRQVVEVR